ncbi:hypothetical protein FACS1894199_10160 [Bacteroidia bacterium]|nr:hypothetical protein FACS1894199_10160 [Bacteroidia bacterium]
MEEKKYKRLPSGNSDFRSIRTENYAYVDKTRYIEMLENESNKNQFFIRPRKFGKSLFFMTLSYYYDLNRLDEFEALFGDLYIGKHPTPERNSYAVLKFDFSGLDTSSEQGFVKSFSTNVQNRVCNFFNLYASIFPDAKKYIQQIEDERQGISSLEKVFDAAEQNKVKLFFIIDEYDHFANDLIAMGNMQGTDIYKAMIAANGLVRDFYERLKNAAKSSIVNRTFITGISPVMLDDLTSGYNVAAVLTMDPKYNEMMGFTQEEVEWLMRETGVNPEHIKIDMTAYYDGYMFTTDGKHSVYNPAMILHFFEQILKNDGPPKNIVDLNMQIDYGRLRRLFKNESNKETLLKIIKEDGIVSELLQKFPIDMLEDDTQFVSLLFYMGLLTIKGAYLSEMRLEIPNYSIKTLYWDYIVRMVKETSPLMTIQSQSLNESIVAMAMEGDISRFIEYVSKNAFSKFSAQDLKHFDEKYIQALLLAYLFMSRIYVPMSEYEAVPGRTDIYLQRDPRLPQVKWEWILELKYCKTAAKPGEIAKLQKEGKEQLKQYLTSHRLGNRPDLKAAVIVFIGKNKYRIKLNERKNG